MALVTNYGLTKIPAYVMQSTVGYFGWMALDGGVTVEAAATTALTSEITTNGGGRAAATRAYEADYKATFYKLFTFTGDLSIYGVGIADSASASSATIGIVHKYASVRNVANLETCAITQKVVFAAA